MVYVAVVVELSEYVTTNVAFAMGPKPVDASIRICEYLPCGRAIVVLDTAFRTLGGPK
jgi:hypothetical protein